MQYLDAPLSLSFVLGSFGPTVGAGATAMAVYSVEWSNCHLGCLKLLEVGCMFKWLVAHWKSTLNHPCRALHILAARFDGIRLLDCLSSLKVLLLEVCAEDVAAVARLRLEAGLVDLGRGCLEATACPGRQDHLHAIKLLA